MTWTVLYGGRVGRDAQLARHRRDLPGQFEVALRQPVVVVRDRDQPYGHAFVPQVDIRFAVPEARQLADGLYELGADLERPGTEVRARPLAQYPPVRQTLVSWNCFGLIRPVLLTASLIRST